MNRSKLFALSVAALVFGIGCDSDGTGPAAETFNATLSGTSERPNSGDDSCRWQWNVHSLRGWQHAELEFHDDRLNNVTASHIHIGGREVAGPIVLLLYSAAASSNPAISGSVTRAAFTSPLGVSFDGLLQLMRAGDTYINIHTDNGVAPTNTGPGDFPGGEIRGQIALQ
jgi:hypothetical protein